MLVAGLPGYFILSNLPFGRLLESLGAQLGVIVVCSPLWLLHSRRYWARLFSRAPQMVLYPGFLRATQLGDADVLWRNVRGITGEELTQSEGITAATITLDIADGESVELDVLGLDERVRQIVEAMEAVWKPRS